MPSQNKSAQKSRAHKTSAGTARGAKRTYLTELEKVLIGNGGVGHKVLRNGHRVSGFKLTGKNVRTQNEV